MQYCTFTVSVTTSGGLVMTLKCNRELLVVTRSLGEVTGLLGIPAGTERRSSPLGPRLESKATPMMSSGVGQTMPSPEGLHTLTKGFTRNRCSLLTSFCWGRLSGRWLCVQRLFRGLLVCLLLWVLCGGSFFSWSVWCFLGCDAATLHGRLFSQLLRAFD